MTTEQWNSSLFSGFSIISVTCLVLIPCSCFRICFLRLLFFFFFYDACMVIDTVFSTKQYHNMRVLRMTTFIPLFLSFWRCHVFSFRLCVRETQNAKRKTQALRFAEFLTCDRERFCTRWFNNRGLTYLYFRTNLTLFFIIQHITRSVLRSISI